MSVSAIKAGRKALLGRKIGMTQVYREDGEVLPVTVIELGPCTILRVKTVESDGYDSLQVGFLDTTKRPARPRQGLFLKAGVQPKKVVRELPPVTAAEVFRVPLVSEAGGTVEYRDLVPGETLLERKEPRSRLVRRVVLGASEPDSSVESGDGPDRADGADEAGESEAPATASGPERNPGLLLKDSSGKVVKEYDLPPGSSVEIEPGATAADGDLLAYVPVQDPVDEVTPGMQIGVSVFDGVARVDVGGLTKGRGFQGNIKRHGFNSGPKSHGTKNIRESGTSGMGTDPGRVLKGKKMPGQTGNVRRKARALEVVEIDRTANIMLVKGAVPGPNGGIVLVQESLKKA